MSYRLLNEEVQQRQRVAEEGIRPTVLIGLGGTGGDVLLKVRKKIFERYGPPSDFPVVQFIYIDTDTSNQHIDSRLLDEFKFTPAERVDAVVMDTAKFTRNLNQHPLIKAWWYPTLHDLGQVREGAGQIRGYSRLALFANFETVKNAVETALNAAMASASMMWDKYRIQVDTAKGAYIYVVASLAGGTGGGMFLDTGFLCKTISVGVTTVGFFVFPGIFLVHQPRIFANSYAALKELEHFTYPENAFPYEWTQGYPPRSRRPLPPPPYNYCYLVDSTNVTGSTLNFASRYSLFEMVANNIFQDFGSSDFAAHKRGVRVNLDAFLNNFYVSELLDPQDPSRSLLAEAFTTRHSTFGMASIQYPADRIKLACASKLSSDIVQRLLVGNVPEAEPTKWVMENFFDSKVALYIGKIVVGGRQEDRHDILSALYKSDLPGRTMESSIRDWLSGLQNDARTGVARSRNLPLSEFLRAEIDKHLVNYNSERQDPDPNKWGDYMRALRRNRENFVKTQITGDVSPNGKEIPSRLRQAVAEIVNDESKGIRFAKTVLLEIRRVLTHDAFPYLPLLSRQVNELTRLVEDKQRSYQALLGQIRQRENESGLTRLLFGGQTMEYLLEQLYRELEQYLVGALKLRARQEALEVCKSVLETIGDEGHVLDEKTGERAEDTGLLGELTSLERALKRLKEQFDARIEEYSKPQEDLLTLFLYEPRDVEERYYRRYIGADEPTRAKNISTHAVELLNSLPSLTAEHQTGVKVMDLPVFVLRHGVEGSVKLFQAVTARPFQTVTDDFEVLQLFFDKYRTESEQIGQLNLLYSKAQVWLEGSEESNFRLTPEKRTCIVGMYEDPNKPNIYQRFKDLLKNKIRKPEQPEPGFFTVKAKNEVVIYCEAAGFPICYSQAVHEMREKYDRLAIDQFVNLHTDRNEFRFREILEITEAERQELEEATRVFLLGLVLGIVHVVYDNEDNVFYVEQRIGLSRDQRFLGTEHRAIRTLIRDSHLRAQLDKLIRAREDELAKTNGGLAKYYAILSRYQEQIYPAIRSRNLSKDTREQATTENLVLRKKLKLLERSSGNLEQFRDEAAEADRNFEDVTKRLNGRFFAINHTWSKAAAVDL